MNGNSAGASYIADEPVEAAAIDDAHRMAIDERDDSTTREEGGRTLTAPSERPR